MGSGRARLVKEPVSGLWMKMWRRDALFSLAWNRRALCEVTLSAPSNDEPDTLSGTSAVESAGQRRTHTRGGEFAFSFRLLNKGDAA